MCEQLRLVFRSDYLIGLSTSSVAILHSDNESNQQWIIPTIVFPHLCIEDRHDSFNTYLAESINIEIDMLVLILT